jgi:hypothetical protein
MSKQSKPRKQKPLDGSANELRLVQQAMGEIMAAVGMLSKRCSEEIERAGEVVEAADLYRMGLRVGRLRAMGEMADALAHVQARALWQATTGHDQAPKPEWLQKVEQRGEAMELPKGLPATPSALAAWLEAQGTPEEMELAAELMPFTDETELAEWRARMVKA